MNLEQTPKYKKLILCLIFDLLGFTTFFIPGVGEFGDVIWAPVSAYLMIKLFKGKPSRIAGVISFVEEALPFTDVIPTFTLMWLYTYTFASEKKRDTE